jgi:quercetin dioxygenase-like cupin family protein
MTVNFRPFGSGALIMTRIFLALAIGVTIGIGGMALARHDDKGSPKRTILSAKDIIEKLDGKEAKVTVVEVTLEPGQSSSPHRHPGPVFGYVLEGEYEHSIDDQPAKTLKTGDTFYEPTGCVHRVAKNAAATGKARILAVIVHPLDAKKISTPEHKKD